MFLSSSCFAQAKDGLEATLIRTATDSEHAVIAVMYWGEDGNRPDPTRSGVVGSAFLINSDGYFVTAAHVLEHYKPNSAQVTVIIKQRDKNGAGMWFDVLERDEQHDLALCKIKNFSVKESKSAKSTDHPIATLNVSSETTEQGQFIAIVGFPLGSWNPTIQMGTIAATETVNPNIQGVPAGRRELLQVSASGNRGNSGGPVISLRTGRVIGVIVQAIPSPLWSAQPVPVMQNSGIMLAVPASWVRDLLTRNHVKSGEHKTKEKLVLSSDL